MWKLYVTDAHCSAEVRHVSCYQFSSLGWTRARQQLTCPGQKLPVSTADDECEPLRPISISVSAVLDFWTTACNGSHFAVTNWYQRIPSLEKCTCSRRTSRYVLRRWKRNLGWVFEILSLSALFKNICRFVRGSQHRTLEVKFAGRLIFVTQDVKGALTYIKKLLFSKLVSVSSLAPCHIWDRRWAYRFFISMFIYFEAPSDGEMSCADRQRSIGRACATGATIRLDNTVKTEAPRRHVEPHVNRPLCHWRICDDLLIVSFRQRCRLLSSVSRVNVIRLCRLGASFSVTCRDVVHSTSVTCFLFCAHRVPIELDFPFVLNADLELLKRIS